MSEIIPAFKQHFSRQPKLIAQAPGRVNLLGEHVDYNDGLVLPAAINRAVHVAAAPTQDGVIKLVAKDLRKQVSFNTETMALKSDLQGQPLPSWALYPAGVAWAMQESGCPLTGIQAVYTSDVPIGAGLSSSAAVEVAFAVVWQALGSWNADRMTLARLCQRAENHYVGVACGLMDQFASAHGVADHALLFDTRSLEWEPVRLPQKTVLVIANSGVRRSLATSAYNERRAACEQAVQILRQYLPGIQALRDISPVEIAAYGEFLPPVTSRRAEHVVKEIARVQSASRALRSGETHAFGALMLAGHASLRDLYEVSTPELDALVRIASHLPGCYGARLTGAGFGGCTINLVEEARVDEFSRALETLYHEQTGRAARLYRCRAADGAKVEIH